jgi:hypothetical protein
MGACPKGVWHQLVDMMTNTKLLQTDLMKLSSSLRGGRRRQVLFHV